MDSLSRGGSFSPDQIQTLDARSGSEATGGGDGQAGEMRRGQLRRRRWRQRKDARRLGLWLQMEEQKKRNPGSAALPKKLVVQPLFQAAIFWLFLAFEFHNGRQLRTNFCPRHPSISSSPPSILSDHLWSNRSLAQKAIRERTARGLDQDGLCLYQPADLHQGNKYIFYLRLLIGVIFMVLERS
ncbi:hypothetical protein NL676_038269 [Syzygium grande]|nr:hypothetical protein NL676_038269 [Syzygium grande]